MERSTTARREEFEALVRRTEQLGADDPAAYRRRFALWATLGYAVLFGVLIGLIAVLAGGVWAALASSAVLIFLAKTKLI